MPVRFTANSVCIFNGTHPGITIEKSAFPELWKAHIDSDPLTLIVEDYARRFVEQNFPLKDAFLIVRLSNAWGGLRGANPGRIYDEHSKDGFCRLRDALKIAHDQSMKGKYKDAITSLDCIKGTGISFRSKFLKFLCPDRAAVLDSQIREWVDYGNTAGDYEKFVRDCIAIRDHLNDNKILKDRDAQWRTCDVEMAIFMQIKKNKAL